MEAGFGSGKKEIHLSKHFAMPVKEDALAAITEVGQEGGRVAVMLVSYQNKNKKTPSPITVKRATLFGASADEGTKIENQPPDRKRGARTGEPEA